MLWVPLAFLFDGVTVLMLPLRVGGGATELGMISLAGLAIAAGLQPVAGWLSDRYRERVDRRSFVVIGAVPAILGLWALVGTTGLAAAVVGYAVLQIGTTGVQAAQQTLIPEHVAESERGRVSGLKAAFDVGGAFLAFVLLGTLLATGDLAPAAFLVTVTLVGAVILVLALVPPTKPAPSLRVRRSPSLPPGLVPLVLARFLFLFGTYAVGRFLLLLVGERSGMTPERAVDEAGWLLALFTLATAVCALPFGWLVDRRSHRAVMVAGALVAGAGILVLAPAIGVIGLVVGGLMMSVGTAAFVTANWAATTAVVPAEEAGRLMAIANLGTGVAAAAAGALGPLIDTAGFLPALLVAAMASVAAILPILDPARRRRPALENET